MEVSYTRCINQMMLKPLFGILKQLQSTWLNVDDCITASGASDKNSTYIDNNCSLFIASRYSKEINSLISLDCKKTTITKAFEIQRLVHDIAHFIDFAIQGNDKLITENLFKWDHLLAGASVGYPTAESRTWPIVLAILNDLPFLSKSVPKDAIENVTKLAIQYQIFHKHNIPIPQLKIPIDISDTRLEKYLNRALIHAPSLFQIKEGWQHAVKISNQKYSRKLVDNL